MPRTHRLAATAMLALALAAQAGCSPAAPQLTDHDYLSVAVTEGGAAKALVNGTRIRLNFGPAEGTDRAVGALVAHAGCNSIAGTYRTEGGRFVFDGAGMTEMGCDPERHAQDDWLAAFLASRPRISLAANELVLDNDSTVIRLLDREVAEPDLNIVGTTWTVVSLIDGDAVTSAPAGATATLLFQPDGTVEVNAGCNRGSGSWKLDGPGINIESIGLTKMACDGPAGALEAAVLQVLGAGTLQASIEANLLLLTGPGGGLQLRG